MRALESEWIDDDTQLVSIDSLCPHCTSTPISAQVKASIDEIGLKHPLLGYRIRHDQAIPLRAMWEMETKPDLDLYVHICMGNNRFKAALELGYTHIATSVKATQTQAVRCKLADMCRTDKPWKRITRKVYAERRARRQAERGR